MHKWEKTRKRNTKLRIVVISEEKERRWDEGRAHRELNVYPMMAVLNQRIVFLYQGHNSLQLSSFKLDIPSIVRTKNIHLIGKPN